MKIQDKIRKSIIMMLMGTEKANLLLKSKNNLKTIQKTHLQTWV